MLDRLPREILVLIGKYIDQVYPDSLLDLVCVNKHCFSVLTILLHRSLKIYVDDLENDQLAKDVTRCSELLLQRVGGYRTIRRLIIVHSDYNKESERCSEFPSQALTQEKLRRYRHRLSLLERSGREEDILEKYTYFPGSQTARDTVHQTNQFWKPLADFISRLPSLVSIIYNSYNQLPPCLLDAIHQHQPQCRLYITRFNLWSLGPEGPEDDYELALLSSPSLHGIGVHIRGFYGEGHYSDNEPNIYIPDILRPLVAGLIPRLKKMVLIQDFPPVSDDSPAELHLPWVGFGQQPGTKKGSLEYLSIYYSYLFEEPFARMWQDDTDFSVLQTLRIGPSLVPEVMELLATEWEFPVLTQLDVNFSPDNYREQDADYFMDANSFLFDQPALSVLRLSGWHPGLATDGILENHGSRLYELSLIPSAGETITLEDLEQVAKNCPFLEKLAIKIKRSKGDAQEVSNYRTIGSLPRLRNLHLELDASDMDLLEEPENPNQIFETPNDPTFNEFEQQYCEKFYDHERRPRNGHLRDAFINSALDEDLARSIFHIISSIQTSCMLESMEVKVTGAGCFSWTDRKSFKPGFHDVLETMGRPRRVRKMNSGEPKVELVEPWELSTRGVSPYEMPPFAKDIFQRVWPAKTDKWGEDWHSFPLAVSAV